MDCVVFDVYCVVFVFECVVWCDVVFVLLIDGG